MPHADASIGQAVRLSSNRTDEASVSRALQFSQQEQPSLSRASEFAADSTRFDSTPPEQPAEQTSGDNFFERSFEAFRAASPAIPLVPDISGNPSPGTAETVQAAFEAGPEVAERGVEFGVRAVGVGLPSVVAGAERLIYEGAELATGEEIPFRTEVGDVEISVRPFEELVALGESAQHAVREFFGNDESELLNIAADIAGGWKTANLIFRGAPQVAKFVTERFTPAIFKPMTTGQASANAFARLSAAEQRVWSNFVGGQMPVRTIGQRAEDIGTNVERLTRTLMVGGEGGLFMAGLPDKDKTDIIFGAVAGTGGQALAESAGIILGRVLRSKASEAFPDRIEQIRQTARSGGDIELEGFPEFLARVQNNLDLGAKYGKTSDEAVASIRATLSESGETGAVGKVRVMTDLSDEQLSRLRSSFDNYRFEVVGEGADRTVLFGLQPGTRLPEGTRTAPSLTDKVIDEYNRTGFLRGERVLVDGQEHRFLSTNVEGENVLVKPLDRGEPYPVPRDRVARLGRTEEALENPRLWQQFRQWRTSQDFRNVGEAFDEFADRFLDDLDDSLRPHLFRYFQEQEAKFVSSRLRPDESRTLQQFRSARRRAIEQGTNADIETRASAKGYALHRMSDGRVKFTDMRNGETTRPFRNEDRASEWLRERQVEMPDVAPKIEGVPEDLLEGVAFPVARSNPGHPPKAELEANDWLGRMKESASGFADAVALHISPLVTNMEDAARIGFRRGLFEEDIWSEAIQPLSQDMRRMQNRIKPFAQRLAGIFRGVDETEESLIKGWLRSERKSTFEAKHDMDDRLIEKAEEARIWLEDLFNEWTARTGVELSADDWMRNYAPDLVDYTSQTGRSDPVEAWRALGPDEQVPNEVQFMSEMWKSGEGALLPQERLSAQMTRMLRSGMFKSFAGENFDRAVRFATETLDDGSAAQRHLLMYLNGARGNVDLVRKRLNEITADVYERLGINIGEGGRVRNLIDASIDQTYGATMAARPALVMRNLMQPQLMLGPVVGHRRVFQAQLDALQPRHREWARRLGILEEREAYQYFEDVGENIGGGSFLRLNSRARNLGMTPYTSADKHNRVAGALAVKRKLEPELDKFLNGEINQTELLENSGLWLMDGPQRSKFFDVLDGDTRGVIGDDPFERAVNFAADEIGSKITNFLYGGRNAHQWLRGTVGRAFGAYSTWPRGYLNYLTQLTTANVRPGIKLKALAQHGIANMATAAAGQRAGVNLSSWVTWNSLWFGGSPIVDFGFDAKTAFTGPDWEQEEAARNVMRNAPRLFVPGGQLFAGDIPTAVERLNQEDEWGAVVEAAGFRQIQDETLPEILTSGPFNLFEIGGDSDSGGLPGGVR